MNLRLIAFILSLAFWSFAGAAPVASPTAQLQTNGRSKAVTSDSANWNLELGYSGQTDILEKGERSVGHSFEISPSVEFGKTWGLGAFLEFETESINNEVVREEGNPGLGDTGLAVMVPVEVTPTMTLSNALVGVLPTSQVSKDEGYRGIISSKSSLPIPFPSVHTNFVNSLKASYIINTFENSPTKGTANPQSSLAYGLTGIYKFNRSVFAGAGGEVRSTHFLDGLNIFRASNQVFVGAKWSRFSSRLAYTNGVVPDVVKNNALDSLAAVQLDDYRQVVVWEISCGF